MKNHPRHPCLVAALILAGTLSAHEPSSTTPIVAHQHPVYLKATTTYALVEESTKDEITVTWEAMPACPDESLVQTYTVTIKRSQAGKAVYSLWSLGLQGIDTDTEIAIADTRNVLVAESALGTLRGAKASERVTPTGRVPLDPHNAASPQIVNDKQVWLMEFRGTSFTFLVRRHGRPGMTDWSTQVITCDDDRIGHDNTPPI